MPRHLTGDAHEWINEIPTVPTHSLAKLQPSQRSWENLCVVVIDKVLFVCSRSNWNLNVFSSENTDVGNICVTLIFISFTLPVPLYIQNIYIYTHTYYYIYILYI